MLDASGGEISGGTTKGGSGEALFCACVDNPKKCDYDRQKDMDNDYARNDDSTPNPPPGSSVAAYGHGEAMCVQNDGADVGVECPVADGPERIQRPVSPDNSKDTSWKSVLVKCGASKSNEEGS